MSEGITLEETIEVLSPILIEQNMALTFQKVRIFKESPQVEIITMHQSS